MIQLLPLWPYGDKPVTRRFGTVIDYKNSE